jgi:hypothetical protein
VSNPNQEKWAKLVAATWTNEDLRKKLLSDPHAVLKEHGIELPAGVDVKVVQNTPQVFHMVLPPKPWVSEVEGQTVDDRLQSIVDGLAGGETTLSHC